MNPKPLKAIVGPQVKLVRTSAPTLGPFSRHVTLNVITGKKRKTLSFHAPAGRRFTTKSVERLLDNAAQNLERTLPGHEFRIVELGPFTFNLISVTMERPAPKVHLLDPTATDIKAAMDKVDAERCDVADVDVFDAA